MSAEPDRSELHDVLRACGISEPIDTVERITAGHIHRTWSVRAGAAWVVCQSLNESVFRDLDACESNLRRIDAHLAGQDEVLVPRLRRDADGRVHHRMPSGATWRVADYAVGTIGGTVARSADEALRAAGAFGMYARVLSRLPGGPLAVTIPGFHDLPSRLAQLESAVAEDAAGRVSAAAALVDGCRAVANEIATRARGIAADASTVHNDAKVSNVRFDARSGVARYVVDLDTTMPGSIVFDVGELLRTAGTDAPEDADPETIRVHDDRIAAVITGFVGGAGSLVDAALRAHLPIAGPLMAIENAVRMLTDHLRGDVYFAISRPGHNADRAAAQLQVAELLFERAPLVAAIARDA